MLRSRSARSDDGEGEARWTYTFSHRVSEANDGKTVSNVAVHVGDLPNKDSYYEREVEFDNPDEED